MAKRAAAEQQEPHDPTLELVSHALGGDERAVATLVDRLTPVIQARVVRSLLRRGGARNGDERERVRDLVQEIFLELFKRDGATLRRWDPRRGASLENFVGLLTERRVISHLRRRRHPEVELDPDREPDSPAAVSPERWTASRQLLRCLVRGLRKTLSPLGWTMFEMLFVWDGSVAEVSRELEMSREAVRKWRTRLRRAARQRAEKCRKIGWHHG